MSIPLTLQNLSSTKKSPTSKSKYTKQSTAQEMSNQIFKEISDKLYDLKNNDLKKKIVILDEFSIQNLREGTHDDIDGAITSRYEPV
jgi:hypothetical protein